MLAGAKAPAFFIDGPCRRVFLRARNLYDAAMRRHDHAGRREATLAFLALLCVHRAWSLVFPLQQGRDFHTYIHYYAQFFQAEPVDHALMLFRTPGAPLFFGLLDALGGPALVDAALTVLFGASLAALFAEARRAFGRATAWGLLALLALLPAYNWAWHTVATESLTCAGVALFAAAVLRAFRCVGAWPWAACGAWAFALAMIRPSGALFGLVCLAAPLAPAQDKGARPRRFAAALAVFAGLTVLWMGHNLARYGEFTLARGGAALLPAHRAFIVDRVMAPENGPASRALADAVTRDLLPRPPYRDRGIGLDLFFASGDSLFFADLIALCDRDPGWADNHALLRRAALEGIAAHPAEYLAGVRDTLRLVFSVSELELHARIKERWPVPEAVRRHREALGLPPVLGLGFESFLEHPAASWLSGGSGRFRPTEAARAAERERVEAIAARYPDFMGAMHPSPLGARTWAALAQAWSWFFALVPLGALCALDPRPAGRAVLVLWGLSLALLALTYMGVDAVFQFRSPFDPVFLLAALAGPAGAWRRLRRA